MRTALVGRWIGSSLVIAACALPAAASPRVPVNAEPNVVGGVGGVVHSSIEAEQDIDARAQIGLFGRLGFSHRWALQLDIARVRNDDDFRIYSTTASALHAFAWKPWLVPMIRLGVGWDSARGQFDDTALHAETGVLLELRLDGGFVLGADVGVGIRGPTVAVCLAEPGPNPDQMGVEIGGCAEPLYETTYRAAKLTFGVAF